MTHIVFRRQSRSTQPNRAQGRRRTVMLRFLSCMLPLAADEPLFSGLESEVNSASRSLSSASSSGSASLAARSSSSFSAIFVYRFWFCAQISSCEYRYFQCDCIMIANKYRYRSLSVRGSTSKNRPAKKQVTRKQAADGSEAARATRPHPQQPWGSSTESRRSVRVCGASSSALCLVKGARARADGRYE